MTKEQPYAAILNRDEACDHVHQHFSAQLALIEDLANYGSNLVVRAFTSSDRSIGALVSCCVLLKQVVGMLDSAQVLLEAGTAGSALLPARTAFEASVYLDWLLFSDLEK